MNVFVRLLIIFEVGILFIRLLVLSLYFFYRQDIIYSYFHLSLNSCYLICFFIEFLHLSVKVSFVDLVFITPFLEESLLSMNYLKELSVFCLLNFKFLFEIFYFFFKTIKINFQLLLDSYMISYFRL